VVLGMPAATLCALATGVVAIATDVRARRIPNTLTAGSALAALVFAVSTAGLPGAGNAIGGCLAGIAIFAVPFALGGMGGGDVKLLGALGAWLGPMAVVWVGLYAAIAGGVMAVIVALCHGYLRTAVSNVRMLLNHWRIFGIEPVHEISLKGSRGPRLAYAIPIFAGLVVAVWVR
jgi:prepilin peptidase CpaA